MKLGVSEDESDDHENSSYVQKRKTNPPESITDDPVNLILGASKTSMLLYGINLAEDYKVCVCSDGIDMLKTYYKILLQSIEKYDHRHTVVIDDSNSTFKSLVEKHTAFQYINAVAELDTFIETLKPELNARLDTPGDHHDPLFILIPEFNTFFDMITNEQAEFMRKVVRYINDPQYRIYFICGYDVSGCKNNDRLFMEFVVNAGTYVLCPNSYEKASEKIETMPLISATNTKDTYFCKNEKNIEIRW